MEACFDADLGCDYDIATMRCLQPVRHARKRQGLMQTAVFKDDLSADFKDDEDNQDS